MTAIEDVVEDLDHRAFGVAPPENQALSYGYDGNGNMAAAGPNTFDYNILNLPIEISGPGGTAYQEYVSSGGKYKKIVEPSGGEIDTIYYLGGVEFINGLPDNYFFGDGRIAWEETPADTLKSWYQYRLTDHLGNTMVFFDDKDEDGQIMTELQTDDPQELEVRQRLWYYPFGMQMDGIVADTTEPHHAYRYNGKELDEVSQTYEYGFRYYDPTIGKFTGVDPIADQFAWVSPFNYAENRPIDGIDLYGLQWVHYQDAQQHTINVNVSVSYDGKSLSKGQFQKYLAAANQQFQNTLEKSSNGRFTGSMTFNKKTSGKGVVPLASVSEFTSEDGVAALSINENMGLSIFDNQGNLQTPEEFALDFVHELFHTIKLDHPFEFTQSSDTELTHFKRNDYMTTENTDSKIFLNIMNYGKININGFNLKKIWNHIPGDLLTPGQLDVMVREIGRQQQGRGNPYEDENYSDYWLETGSRVEKN